MKIEFSSEPTIAPDIVTSRLDLVTLTPATIRADRSRSSEFSELIAAEVPAEWPPEGWDEHAYDYVIDKFTKYPNSLGWGRYIVVRTPTRGHRILAGTCGATLPIELKEDVEIGYGMLPAFQRCGYATEAVAGLTSWIFEHQHVRSICAQTFPHLFRSIRVLEKNGFSFAGSGFEDGAILFRKQRRGEGLL